ncbi:hypothetical protein Ahy_A01g003954 [Arachis hypogaea]|uniref:Uncharacterized protein n=1 Tax=Arachis hypogaea TaxID=3818 RepID=A0A445EUC0_ARAHY|nr:hypothetical protein Ahy_A01g003954 [Arachis hypogaea]
MLSKVKTPDFVFVFFDSTYSVDIVDTISCEYHQFSVSLSFLVIVLNVLDQLFALSYESVEEKKQAAADVLFQYSKFVMASIGNQVRPCDLRLHLMKEISGMPTSLNRESTQVAASPDAMGESSSSGTARLDKVDSFRAL